MIEIYNDRKLMKLIEQNEGVKPNGWKSKNYLRSNLY